MQIISKFLKINAQSIHVKIYNPDHKRTIVCWHGLARNHSDFHTIASRLASRYRVICPDTLGRGFSQWAKDPIKEYTYPNYVNMALGICDHFHAQNVDWIGTSMGGIIGMLIAGSADPGRIRRLVINDVGPEIPKEALDRIISYTSGPQPEFETYPEFEAYFRELYAPMGTRTADEWFNMASQSLRRKDNGNLTIHFDTRIVQISDDTAPPVNLWDVFKQVTCPVMLLHGKNSDILLDGIVRQMQQINSEMELVTIPECGHAPGLHRDHHMEPVLDFLS